MQRLADDIGDCGKMLSDCDFVHKVGEFWGEVLVDRRTGGHQDEERRDGEDLP